MPVELPDLDPKRLLARTVFDALISGVPLVGGPYAAMLSVTHPSKMAQLQSQWQADVTAAVNNMEEVINDLLPIITLSALAVSIGIWASRSSRFGRGELVEFSAIQPEFPNASKLALEDALGELEFAGLARLQGAIGHKIVLVVPTSRFYEVFDPVAFDGTNPRADAAAVARFILASDSTVTADMVMVDFGWDVRRYNPAIAIVGGMIGEGRKSREIHPAISCRSVAPNSSERAALRHFADRVLGAETLQ